MSCSGGATSPAGDTDGDVTSDGDEDTTPPDGDDEPDMDPEPDPDGDDSDEDKDDEPVICTDQCLSVNPTTIDFGAVGVNTCLSKKIQVTSVGATTIKIFSIALSSSDTSPEFSITKFDPSEPPMDLKQSHMVEVEITYCPVDSIDDTGTLYISTDSMQKPRYDITLLGGFKGTCSLTVETEECISTFGNDSIICQLEIKWGDIEAIG